MKVANPFITQRNRNIREEFETLNATMDYIKAIRTLELRYNLSSNVMQIILLGIPRWRVCECGTRFLKGKKKTKWCLKCRMRQAKPKALQILKREDSEFFSWKELKSSPMVMETYLNRDTEKKKARVMIPKHGGIITLAL